jgi:hypothetical protein
MSFWFYPITATGVLVSELDSHVPSGGWHASNIEIINMLGEVVAQTQNVAMKGTREIDLPNIAAGQYLVKIINNNKLLTEKVYLNR